MKTLFTLVACLFSTQSFAWDQRYADHSFISWNHTNERFVYGTRPTSLPPHLNYAFVETIDSRGNRLRTKVLCQSASGKPEKMYCGERPEFQNPVRSCHGHHHHTIECRYMVGVELVSKAADYTASIGWFEYERFIDEDGHEQHSGTTYVGPVNLSKPIFSKELPSWP